MDARVGLELAVKLDLSFSGDDWITIGAYTGVDSVLGKVKCRCVQLDSMQV